ncbi:MAG: hypothetical protein HW416_1226 [Chloroflexi bacterium]|nr:hypothetical protein [Chloroflexota bacterium]
MAKNGVGHDDVSGYEPEDELYSVSPGDVLEFWGEGTLVVTTVFRCQEEVGGRTVRWRWMFLDDGSLIEASLDGYFRYKQHEIVNQGSVLYEELVAQDGALVRFEEHVRTGDSGRRPVHVAVRDKQYRLTSTGTVRAERLGEAPTLLPWSAFATKSDDNVYFGMVEAEEEAEVVLGLWTAHVCLSVGHEFERSDITEIYRRSAK